MTKIDKLLSQIRSLSSGLRFEELQRVLEYYGYTMSGPSGGSSHRTFRKPGRSPITIPMHANIKKVYVEIIKDIIEREDNNENS